MNWDIYTYIIRVACLYLREKTNTAQKRSFSSRISSVNVTNAQFPADWVTFTEEILNGNLHFLCSVMQVV